MRPRPSSAPRRGEAAVEVPPSGLLRLVAVADTHSEPHPAALELIRREAPGAILHAGDIGDLGVLDRLGETARVIAVRGNVDASSGGSPPDSVRLEVRRDGNPVLAIFLTHIAVDGPRLRRDALEAALRHGAGLVVCGHSHVPLVARTQGVAVFNPGSMGPRRFRLPVTFGVIEIDATGVRFRHVDCETGERWAPG